MSNQIVPVADAVIVSQQNITTIAQAGPKSYTENVQSCQKCTEAGQRLLDEIKKHGMSDELDQRIAVHIERARKTVKVMNERRAPVTKLFDMVRAEYTALENNINPTTKGTIPYELQQYRNEYAARKRQEEERRRQAELAEQEHLKAKETFRASVSEDFWRQANELITREINLLSDLNASVTLENYAAVSDTLIGYCVTLPPEWQPISNVRRPYNLSPDEVKAILTEELAELRPKCEERFRFEIEGYRNEILDRLPSKKIELERMAQADIAEKERLAAQIAAREAEAAAAKERDRLKAEAEARQKAELDKANAEMAGLFSMAKTELAYTPKTKVAKRLHINDPQAFLAIVSMWWQSEGCKMTVEELSKTFKKQITFCEKLANKENVFVESPGLEYIDEVKAQ